MSSKTSNRLPSKKELIADLKSLAGEYPSVQITRNFYRGNGKFKEAHWQKHYANFTAFLDDAGVKTEKNPNQVEVTGDKLSFSLPKTSIHTLEDLIAHFEVDTSIWEVERFVANSWEMGSGGGGKIPLYQVKATFVRRKAIVDAIAEIARLKDEAKKYAPVPRSIGRPAKLSGNMLEISLSDAHFGKLAWGRETGGPNYDTSIAERVFTRALDTLISRSSGYKFDQILFVVGNDLLNSDNLQGTTTKGTYVDTDGRYHKTFTAVRKCITEAIEKLRTIAPVKVLMVSGNHDDLSVWHLGDSLECYFSRYSDVEIFNEPTTRKYHEFGNVLLCFTHGDKGKRTDYPLLMATERPEAFGRTKFREIHTGHTHQTKTEEMHGIRVRTIPSLSPADAWHAENGYVGNQRNAEAYLWNRDEGLIAQFYHNDDAYPVLE